MPVHGVELNFKAAKYQYVALIHCNCIIILADAVHGVELAAVILKQVSKRIDLHLNCKRLHTANLTLWPQFINPSNNLTY